MRQTFVTGSLVASLVLLLCLPGLGLRPIASAGQPAPPAAQRPGVVPPVEWNELPWLVTPLPSIRRGTWADALSALEGSKAPREGDDRGLHDFLQGVLLLRTARPLEALAPLRSAAGWAERTGSALEARAWFHLGEAHEALADPRRAAAAFGRSADASLGAAADRARLRQGQALAAGGDAQRALHVLVPLASGGAEDALMRAQDIRLAAAVAALPLAEATGDEVALSAARRVLILDFPCSQASRDLSGGKADAQARLAEFGAPAILDRCERLVAGGSPEALADLTALASLAKASGKPPSDRVELLLGRTLRATGGAKAALEHLRRVGPAEPALVSRATWEAAQACTSLKETRDARRFLQACADGPATTWRDQAALKLAAADSDAGRLTAAREAWAEVATDGADARVRARAGWRLAWSQHRSGLKSAALASYDALAAAEPREREAAAARYWAARILRDRGETAQTRERLESLARDFPRDYYGIVAADEVGQADTASGLDGFSCDSLSLEDALAQGLGRIASSDPAAAAVARELLRLGLVADALEELGSARVQGDADASLARAECTVIALALAGRRVAALRALRDAAPDWRSRTDLAPAVWCAVYPLVYDDIVVANCHERGLDPALVCGLIHQESVFEPAAISWVGARGLMQVMPATGRTIAGWFDERVTTAQLVEPARNVRYGTEYLQRLIAEFGHVEPALAGYNAGGGRARRWWKAVGGRDVPLFVESIPFDETREYVKAITWSSRMYRKGWPVTLGIEAPAPESNDRITVASAIAGDQIPESDAKAGAGVTTVVASDGGGKVASGPAPSVAR